MDGPVCESIRLYNFCKGMEWTHLPVTGGIYEQHPKLIDDFEIIMQIDNEVQRKKDKKSRDGNKTLGKSAGRRRGR